MKTNTLVNAETQANLETAVRIEQLTNGSVQNDPLMTEFLDRDAAFDRVSGRLVEVPGARAQRSGQPD
ncbi:MAG TPA: hypothetical protein VGY98_14555 [Verrucomicrobiae bacterium]|nr:hypothetical protein [Verrucomicrobiae bacterium]